MGAVDDMLGSIETKQLIAPHVLEGYRVLFNHNIELEIRKVERFARVNCLNAGYDKDYALEELKAVVKAKKIIERIFEQLKKQTED